VSEWVICRKCGLKYRAREATCPRCENPTEEAQIRWSEEKAPPTAPEASPFWIALPVGVVFALLGSFVFLGPPGHRASGNVTIGCVVAGMLLIGVSWAWTATVAFREGVGWVLFVVFVPVISVAVLRKWPALAAKVAGVGAVVLGVVVFAPATGLADDITRLCESKGTTDGVTCACIGKKTVVLMTSEDRKKPFNHDSPQMNELMLTAGQVCLRDHLVARCVGSKQGTEALCLCIMEKALNAFTPAELDLTLERVAAGAAPEKYTAIRADCLKR
jgi:hypothetical protein